ncbi:hypothetical protein ACLOJK_004059 [Asimina triloba]
MGLLVSGQAACVPSILSGKDVVVAAETGSGKTHGYLVPLFEKLCAPTDPPGISDDTQVCAQPHKLLLVLCPNVMLCEQVVRMANCLCSSHGEPLLKVYAGWPVVQPDVLVSTPAALLNCLFAHNPEKGWRMQFLHDVKYVVFDEADMLLCGSFQNQVVSLINLLRFDEKRLSKIQGSTLENSEKLNTDAVVDFLPEGEELLAVSNSLGEDDSEDALDLEDVKMEENGETKASSYRSKDWRRVRKTYIRSKQYIFVAATLPESGKKTAGGVLKLVLVDISYDSLSAEGVAYIASHALNICGMNERTYTNYINNGDTDFVIEIIDVMECVVNEEG